MSRYVILLARPSFVILAVLSLSVAMRSCRLPPRSGPVVSLTPSSGAFRDFSGAVYAPRKELLF